MSDPTPAPTPVAPATPMVPAAKPEIKQISTWIGTAALGAAGFIVSNPAMVTALIPPPWNAVAAVVLGAAGAGLVAYREKVKPPTESK